MKKTVVMLQVPALALLLFAPRLVIAAWDFRGEPNDWGQTPMHRIAPGKWETVQRFGPGQDEFKIAQAGGWQLSFPAQNAVVTPNKDWVIQFDDTTHQIDVSVKGTHQWMFRGTTNGWGETPLTAVSEGQFEICQHFGLGDSVAGPRFKIAREGWQVSHPEDDYEVADHQAIVIRFNERTRAIQTLPVSECADDDQTFAVKGQHSVATFKNMPFKIQPSYLIVLGENEPLLEIAQGQQYEVTGQVITPAQDFVGTLHIPITVMSRDQQSVQHVFELEVVEELVNKQLIIHQQAVLSDHQDLTLTRFFNHLATQANEPDLSGVHLFRRFWDTQNSAHAFSFGPSCDDERLADGITPAINGFPVVCDREEGKLVKQDDFAVQQEMDKYFPIAAVNRFDLHAKDFSDCGEYRMIFARSTQFGFGRNFLIAEARVANPRPGDALACMPLVQFWLTLSQKSERDISRALEQLYFQGVQDFPPVFSIKHFNDSSGQLRTNQFISASWMLREDKLDHACGPDACELSVKGVSVKENPFGPLFNGTLPFTGSEFSQRAADFQAQFIERIGSLIGASFADLSVSTDDAFNHGQSHASGNVAENNFNLHFNQGRNSDFFFDLQQALVEKTDALGRPLSTTQLLNRATALTCGGCHQPAAFGLTQNNALGALRLPDGSTINRWPFSNGFVHVNEFPNRDGDFGLSQALMDVFLPIRMANLKAYMALQAK